MNAGPDAHLRWLAAETTAFAAVLRRVDHGAPVAACAPWTVTDLALHLGGVHRWAEAAAREGRGDHRPDDGPRESGALADWYEAGARTLVATLAELDPEATCWTFAPPSVTGFWRRRQAMETAVHRWDAEHAAGAPGPIDPRLAADGVDEVVGTMFPRQVQRGRATEPHLAVALVSSDTGDAWALGAGGTAGEVTGAAEALLLLLWRRIQPDDPAFDVSGDRAAVRSALDRPLTP